MYAPKGIPKPIIDKLSVAPQSALRNPEVKDRLAESGAETVELERARPQALRINLQSEIDRWVPTIKKVGVQEQSRL